MGSFWGPPMENQEWRRGCRRQISAPYQDEPPTSGCTWQGSGVSGGSGSLKRKLESSETLGSGAPAWAGARGPGRQSDCLSVGTPFPERGVEYAAASSAGNMTFTEASCPALSQHIRFRDARVTVSRETLPLPGFPEPLNPSSASSSTLHTCCFSLCPDDGPCFQG